MASRQTCGKQEPPASRILPTMTHTRSVGIRLCVCISPGASLLTQMLLQVKDSTIEFVKNKTNCVALKIEDEMAEDEMTEAEINAMDACYNLATALAEYY